MVEHGFLVAEDYVRLDRDFVPVVSRVGEIAQRCARGLELFAYSGNGEPVPGEVAGYDSDCLEGSLLVVDPEKDVDQDDDQRGGDAQDKQSGSETQADSDRCPQSCGRGESYDVLASYEDDACTQETYRLDYAGCDSSSVRGESHVGNACNVEETVLGDDHEDRRGDCNDDVRPEACVLVSSFPFEADSGAASCGKDD